VKQITVETEIPVGKRVWIVELDYSEHCTKCKQSITKRTIVGPLAVLHMDGILNGEIFIANRYTVGTPGNSLVHARDRDHIFLSKKSAQNAIDEMPYPCG
jgi:hypothetical protein